MWGGSIEWHSSDDKCYKDCALLAIKGSIKSYTLLLDFELTIDMMTERLENLKKEIYLNSSSVALINVSPGLKTDHNFVEYFKVVFPFIRVMTISASSAFTQVSMSSETGNH